MQTSAIRYRVVDFLRDHAPFHAMDEDDLLGLVAGGRVRFHEIDEYVYTQGQAVEPHFLVVQQGTVSLWEESDGESRLRDVRGPGDLLGIDGFLGHTSYRHGAKAASDVVLYALPSADFAALLRKYASAARYLAAHGSVSVAYEGPDPRRQAPDLYVHDMVRTRTMALCAPSDSVREAARSMVEAGASTVVVVEGERLRGTLGSGRLLRGIADATIDVAQPVETAMETQPPTAGPDTTVAACVLALAASGAEAIVITHDGSPRGRAQAAVTSVDLAPAFGDHPLALLRELAPSPGVDALRALNVRARAFILDELTAPRNVDWLAAFAARFDAALAERLIASVRPESDRASWFFFGASGRGESLTAASPQLGLVFDSEGGASARETYGRVFEDFARAGYVGRAEISDADLAFRCASLDEWRARFRAWVRDPVGAGVYQARPLFDLTPLAGGAALAEPLAAIFREEVARHPEFLRVLANDCLANLPPLAFFRDAVIEDDGERQAVFHLERSALRPLVDVGRVVGIAAGLAFGSSTLQRLTAARRHWPAHDAVFREASDTLRVLLYHQARSGIRRQDAGTEIAPQSLGGYERQVLKTGFRSILRLLELVAEGGWLNGR